MASGEPIFYGINRVNILRYKPVNEIHVLKPVILLLFDAYSTSRYLQMLELHLQTAVLINNSKQSNI